MSEQYPYNDEFEAYEVPLVVWGNKVKVMAQASGEDEFNSRMNELKKRIDWLETMKHSVYMNLQSNGYTRDEDEVETVHEEDITLLRCYAEMSDDGIALDMIIGMISGNLSTEISMFIDEFDMMEILGEA